VTDAVASGCGARPTRNASGAIGNDVRECDPRRTSCRVLRRGNAVGIKLQRHARRARASSARIASARVGSPASSIALNPNITHLHRRSIGPIALDGQPVGESVPLSPAEVDALWAAVGGRERTRRAQRAALQRQAQKARDQAHPDPRLEDWLRWNPG